MKSLEWYNRHKDRNGNVNVPQCFVSGMSRFCGQVLTISDIYPASCYLVKEAGFNWTDEMFEGLESEVNSGPVTIKKIDISILPSDFDSCAKLLGVSCHISEEGYMGAEFRVLQKLFICRNAYWAIADNWKPNYKSKEKKHCIVARGNKLGVATTIEISRNFAFPTPEMAQAFHNNFGPDLEFCKEML